MNHEPEDLAGEHCRSFLGIRTAGLRATGAIAHQSPCAPIPLILLVNDHFLPWSCRDSAEFRVAGSRDDSIARQVLGWIPSDLRR